MDTSLTLYDMAKQMLEDETFIDPIEVNKVVKEISALMNKKYYMIICPDLRQYIVLHINNKENIKDELVSIFNNRGNLLLIDRDNEKNEIWEFWLKDIYDNKIYMYQLTPYEVVEV